jgi:hypothetical protein
MIVSYTLSHSTQGAVNVTPSIASAPGLIFCRVLPIIIVDSSTIKCYLRILFYYYDRADASFVRARNVLQRHGIQLDSELRHNRQHQHDSQDGRSYRIIIGSRVAISDHVRPSNV